METAEQAKSEKTFDQRYYETLRSQRMVPEIGRIALDGLQRRRYEEITSGLAEALPGVIRTYYSFKVKNKKIIAEDGENFETFIEKGYETDKQLAQEDDFYKQFLLQRSEHEKQEFKEQEAMANGERAHNTLVTFSPYSEELDSPQTRAKLTNAAQKPHWKRGMLRISHWDGQRLHVSTRSIDNSSVELFRELAEKQFNYQFEAEDSTAMLGERIPLIVKDKSWQELPDAVVATADKILSKRHGGIWQQGRSKEAAKDVQEFVESQSEIVDALIKIGEDLALKHNNFESYKKAFEEQLYDYAALLEQRLEVGVNEKITDIEAASSAAGSMARAEGKVYDMCGKILGTADNSAAQAANQSGYESLKRLANKKIECPECKNKGVVATKDLEAGLLYCKGCDYGVDVCTGKKFSRGVKQAKRKDEPTLFEIIATDLARYDEQIKQKRLAQRRKKQELDTQTHDYKLSA